MSIAVEQVARGPQGLVVQCLRNIGPYENNIFIVSDETTREAYVLDAGFEPEAIASAAAGLTVDHHFVLRFCAAHAAHRRQLDTHDLQLGRQFRAAIRGRRIGTARRLSFGNLERARRWSIDPRARSFHRCASHDSR